MSDSVEKKMLTEDAARRMIAAAVEKAKALGVAQVVAVLDDSGTLKSFCRMDGAPVISVQVAQDKAYTALFGLPSAALYDAIQGQPALAACLPLVPRMTLIGGGVPIRLGGALVGAVGVGGGTVEQDVACAEAALGVLGVRGPHAPPLR